MKTARALLISIFLLSACSSDMPEAPLKNGVKTQDEKEPALKYELREPAFDSAKKAEPPKVPESSLDK